MKTTTNPAANNNDTSKAAQFTLGGLFVFCCARYAYAGSRYGRSAMRAKFQVINVTPSPEGVNPPYEKLEFMPVSHKPFDPDGVSEDNSFARWTPSGSLSMQVNNPALHGQFKIGDQYYLDFTKFDDACALSAEIAPTSIVEDQIAQTKLARKHLDEILQGLKRDSEKQFTGFRAPDHVVRSSRERSLAITKVQEAIMWLGMDLKAINEESPGASPNPYPQSYNPESPVIEPTADGLKL